MSRYRTRKKEGNRNEKEKEEEKRFQVSRIDGDERKSALSR